MAEEKKSEKGSDAETSEKRPIFERMRRTKRTEEAEERVAAQSKKMVLKKKRSAKRAKVLKRPTGVARNIGVAVLPPESTCNDPHCPFHGKLRVRGQIIKGVVVSDAMQNSAVVAREYRYYVKKYERYEKRTRRYIVHNPPCINAKEGDWVKVMECRPISKHKSFVIIEKGVW